MKFEHSCGYVEDVIVKCPSCGNEMRSETLVDSVASLIVVLSSVQRDVDTMRNDVIAVQELLKRVEALEKCQTLTK